MFSFLDLRVLWTLKSFLVLIFRMSSVDRKTNQRQWSEKPMGNTIQFVPSLLSAVYSVVVASYNFLTCEKHLIRFIETSFNYMQRKLLQRLKRWFNLPLHILLSAMQEMKILYILWREIFPVSHWRQSYFHSLVSLQQFILPFDVQSIFSLLVQQRWVSILFSAKYNEGNHLNIQSRNLHCKLFYSRMSTKIWLPVPGCQQRFFVKNSIPSINIPEMADLHYSSFPEQLIGLFLFHFQQGLQQNLE